MADSTLILLDPVSTPAPTDLFGVRQSGDSRDKKMTRAQVHTLESGEFLRYGWDSAIDVTGLTLQGDYVLSTSHNSVGTITADGQAVTLPATSGLVVGDHILVENDHATKTLFVFPAASHTIYGKDTTTGNDRAVNVHVALGPKSSVLFAAQSGSGYEIVYRTNELTKNDVLGSTERDMTAPDTDGDIFGFSAHWSNAGGLPAGGDGSILTKTYDSDYAAQIYQDWADGALWVRGREGAGAWTAWAEVAGAAAPSINEQNSNYTTVLSDAGKTIYKASGGPPRVFTIDSNANVPYPIGTIIRFALGTSRNASVDITDDTLIWTIDGTVGERDLEEAGYAIAQKVEATTWKIVSTPQVLSFGIPLEADMPDGSLTADVGSSQGDGVIIAPYNVYSVVGTAGDAATLPAAYEIGTRVYIKNNDATESMDVFPASGDNLGEGIDAALAVPAGTSVTFIATTRNSIWTQLIVPTYAAVFTVEDGIEKAIASNVTLGARVMMVAGDLNDPAYNFVDDNDTGLHRVGSDEIALIAGSREAVAYREASNGVVERHRPNIGLTAHVGSSQGDGLITSSYNVYTTVANAGDAATLPAAAVYGALFYIKNDTEQSMDVFPNIGADLGAGVNDPVSVPGGTSVTFMATVANTAFTQLVAPAVSIPDPLIIPTGGTVSTPKLAFGDGDTGFWEDGDDTLRLSCGTAAAWKFDATYLSNGSGAAGPWLKNASSNGVTPNMGPKSDDLDTGWGSNVDDELGIAVGGVKGIFFKEVSSGVLVSYSANTGLTAHVGSSQGDGVILSTYNVYTTVATAGDAATLPATFFAGTQVFVKNDTESSMDVFPASGDDAGAGVDTVVAVGPGEFAVFLATAANATWTKLMGGTA